MKLIQKIKIEAVKNDTTLTSLSENIGISRENMYYHINKNNPFVIEKIEVALNLSKNFFKK
ncbi:hypothetical protein [Psychrilyobacter atlanticus]|uniref:hypothetical protein n=1 Tax=Psychrilyobacter atlanticus TaxID=271091 RepID=UPI000412CCB6|nr:hypothetical protein [Psychrilyobacter atlanticus]